MEFTVNKKIIVALIEDDLTNLKLVLGLEKLGLNASKFNLHLSDTIFRILDIQDEEESEIIYQDYISLSEKIASIDISISKDNLNLLAIEICDYLIDKIRTQKVVHY